MKKTEPRFSIIIPNFNNGSTLARALNSALCQTTPAYEIIVVDDGSTDDSRQIAESFGDRIRYFWQPNGGVSSARNFGAEMAGGDWLAFLDADDEYAPNRIEAHASWVEMEPEIDFLLADQESRTPEGQLLETFIAKSSAGRALMKIHGNAQRIPLHPSDFELMTSDGFAEIRTVSLSREKFISVGGFSTNHKIGEDLHFFIRLFASSEKAGFVPEILSTYYIYPSSVLRKNPVTAMRQFVAAIESLEDIVRGASLALKRGYKEKCRQNRLSLAYALLRDNQKRAAVETVLISFINAPSLVGLKDVLSIFRGFPDNLIPTSSAVGQRGARIPLP